ncbi:hypothetical protein NR798_30285 [Archangium gephyra]|uniref:hypothetical protein n=1 Tax=Archangium gephyra TaxID=48 RepID=UPI0035D49C84
MSPLILRIAAVLAGLVPLVFSVLPGPVRAQASATPSITWNTYLGGTAASGGPSNTDDYAEGVITNRAGDTFVTGRTNAPGFPGGLSTPPLVTGGEDAFVTKLYADGGVAWTRVFGGTGNDTGMRLALVPYRENRLYVVGTTSASSSNPAIGNVGKISGSSQGGTDAFLARLELDGTVSWFQYLGGPGDDEGRDVYVYEKDGYEVVYVVGKRGGDVFVTQVDDLAADPPRTVWDITFGSPGNDVGYAVATNEYHRVFVGGLVSQNIPSTSLPKVLGEFGGGGSDGFVAQLNPDGGMNWFQFLGGNGDDDVRDVLNQPESGGMTVIGNSLSTDFPAGFTRKGREIFMVRVVGDNGDLQPKKVLIGEGGEFMEGHASADTRGNIYVGGTTTSTNLAVNAFDPSFDPSGGGVKNDGFVAMVDPDLTGFVWASYVGGNAAGSESVMGLSGSPLGQLVAVGRSNADAGLLVSDAGHDPSYNGGQDLFVFRLAVNPDAGPATRPDGGTPDASTPDASTPDASTPDASTPGTTDAGTDPEELLSPLGWGCGSSGGGTLAGAVALMALALLTRTRRSSR